MFPSVSQLDDLNGFTDVFGDEVVEENVSQPISLPTTCDSIPESLTDGLATNCTKNNRPLKHTGQHGEFRSVEEIDPKYRCLFTYPYFNLVQSRIIEDALYSDKSMVVCAPTGSGKTVVFELAILQLLMQMEDKQISTDFKIIYMAPVKAVCNERLTEWYPKLTKLGLLCVEVTGDTEVDFAQLKPYRVIITTPEKWDMLTRRWRDHRGLIEMIKLFLIDEVHILNDESRGPVLEAVVSRMKTVESAAQSAHRIEQLQKQYQGAGDSTHCQPPRIRFVAVSATVSNPEDVADWLGTSEKPAVFYKFGDECRPVKLQRVVEGYPCAEGTSIFKFDLILNYKLWPIIQKYYNGKPTLIFCNTRKSVTLTAEALSREVTVTFSPEQKAKLSALASTIKNKKLQMLIMSGVGCHHAGMLYEERVNIERAFRNRDLPILITTTTLAMGVNLPAHLVIVKNTQQYVNGAYQEYSISTVLQMVGRAGRPQFDTEATAVIMTRLNDKPRYQALVGGSEPLQSYLHKRLAENLNSEAALGTVTDVAQCVEWLRSTFLYVRAAKDPKRYLGLPQAAPMQLILKKIEELCVKAMNSLASSGLITMDEASCIESTEAGRLMSVYYLDVETMKNIMKIEGSETVERLLWLVCESHELSDMHLRMDERRCLNTLNRNNAAATIRFPMKGKISTRQMKLNCIIQATLGCLSIPDPSLNQEALKVMKTASRVCMCLVRYVSHPELVSRQPQCFTAVLNSIILSKCIEAHLWENSPYVSKQLRGIGQTFSTLLASAGVTSFMLLEESHPRDLERIMNKGPPAGNVIRKQVSLLPKYQLTVTPIDSRSIRVELMLLNHAHLSENMNQLTAGDSHKSYLIVGDSENNLLLLTHFTDKDLISVYDGTMKYEVTRKLNSEHKILIRCVSSTIVGIDAQADYLFLDLEPQAPRESSFFCSGSNVPRKNVIGKQTTITDVYKERKRKNNCDTDITQCKEKKKRENTLTQKLMALKDSFSKTSKALKKDINQSAEMSNKIIHDLLDRKNNYRSPSQSMQNVPLENPTVDLTKDVLAGPLEEIIIDDDDEYIDDSQIDNILNNIESEISGNNPISNDFHGNNLQTIVIPNVISGLNPIEHNERLENSYRNMNKLSNVANRSSSSRYIKDSRNRKINKKSNFSCIDFIEKKANTAEPDNMVDKINDTGFSDTIKCHITKFLERTQKKTKLITPQINELLETTANEELPEVYIKRGPSSEDLCNEIHELDTIPTKPDNDTVESMKIESPQVLHKDIRPAHHYTSDAKKCNLPEVHLKSVPNLETNPYAESKVTTSKNSLNEFDNHIFDCNEVNVCKEHNRDDKKCDVDIHTSAQLNISNEFNTTTLYNGRSSVKAVSDSNINNDSIQSKARIMHKQIPIKTSESSMTSNETFDTKKTMSYRDKVEIYCNNLNQIDTHASLIPWQNKNQTTKNMVDQDKTKVNKSVTLYQDDKNCHLDMLSSTALNRALNAIKCDYSDKLASTSNISTILLPPTTLSVLDKQPPVKQTTTDKVIMPHRYAIATDCSKLDQIYWDNLLVKKSATLHKDDCTNNSHEVDKYCTSRTNWAAPHKTRVTDLKSLPSTEIVINNSTTNFLPSALNKNEQETKYLTEEERHDTNSKKYSYTATKVDVCSRKFAPDHELRITRKLKIDVDMEIITQNKSKAKQDDPEIITQNKSKAKQDDPSKDQVNVTMEQSNEIANFLCENSHTITRNVHSEHNTHNFNNIANDIRNDMNPETIKQTTTITENVEPNKQHEPVKSEIANIDMNAEDNTYSFMNTYINVINEHKQIKNCDTGEILLGHTEEKPNYSVTNNSVGNILQKYSKILIKRETNAPNINKINQKISDNSTVASKTIEHRATVPKSRKPFRISEINTMDVTLPSDLTKVVLAPSNTALNTAPTVEYVKNEIIPEEPEVHVASDINFTPKICEDDDRCYESPNSVHSLQLDPIEDIKDDNMFNPKLLLQYMNEGNKEDTDIIAPPAPFSDDVLSKSPDLKTELEDYKEYLQIIGNDMQTTRDQFNKINTEMGKATEDFNTHNYSALDNSTSSKLSPKEIETWCLSRDEDCDDYASQPVPSAPWIISQRLPNSQANISLGPRRANLCQFRFVRKKPLKF